jgi:hypothetical protein
MSNFNFSASATDCNAENLLVILRPELAVAYATSIGSPRCRIRRLARLLIGPHAPAVAGHMRFHPLSRERRLEFAQLIASRWNLAGQGIVVGLETASMRLRTGTQSALDLVVMMAKASTISSLAGSFQRSRLAELNRLAVRVGGARPDPQHGLRHRVVERLQASKREGGPGLLPPIIATHWRAPRLTVTSLHARCTRRRC